MLTICISSFAQACCQYRGVVLGSLQGHALRIIFRLLWWTCDPSANASRSGLRAEWLKMREGRGIEERKLYGRSPGVLPLPLPTEPFQWRRLPDIQDPITTVRPFPRIKFPVLPASDALAPDSDLGLVRHCTPSRPSHVVLHLLDNASIMRQSL